MREPLHGSVCPWLPYLLAPFYVFSIFMALCLVSFKDGGIFPIATIKDVDEYGSEVCALVGFYALGDAP